MQNEANPILKLTFEFSLAVISYCEELNNGRKFVLSQQLCKSGTSIGANANEAQDAESKADFIHKFKIAAKEMRETKYWLQLMAKANDSDAEECRKYWKEAHELTMIFSKIIITIEKRAE